MSTTNSSSSLSANSQCACNPVTLILPGVLLMFSGGFLLIFKLAAFGLGSYIYGYVHEVKLKKYIKILQLKGYPSLEKPLLTKLSIRMNPNSTPLKFAVSPRMYIR